MAEEKRLSNEEMKEVNGGTSVKTINTDILCPKCGRRGLKMHYIYGELVYYTCDNSKCNYNSKLPGGAEMSW